MTDSVRQQMSTHRKQENKKTRNPLGGQNNDRQQAIRKTNLQ